MPDIWVFVAAFIGLVLSVYLLIPRQKVEMSFENEREERLARKLAAMVGCAVAEALPAVRRELELNPKHPDETLLKWAAYHYRQSLPEGTSCSVYRDRAPG
ncbi:MAG: hypothetical protein L0241_32015 [Planctomycetia bacterium]|nr:hypothetical protein [Planctomycetia bacterium]